MPETDRVPPLSWPHNQRHLLPAGHGRMLVDASAYLPVYDNCGQYPGALGIPGAPPPPFYGVPNRASRRRSGNFGPGHRIDYRPRISPRVAPYSDGTRTSVTERQKRRALRVLAGGPTMVYSASEHRLVAI